MSTETVARRILNLRHASIASDLETAFEAYGKHLSHAWSITPLTAEDFGARVVFGGVSGQPLGRLGL